MTRRERIEARLERRRTWAAGRTAKAATHFDTAHKIVENIPLGQPILVGHHSEKRHRRDIDRMASNMSKGVESAKMADLHRSKAGNIEAALESSIYSDDPDGPAGVQPRQLGPEHPVKASTMVEGGALTPRQPRCNLKVR